MLVELDVKLLLYCIVICSEEWHWNTFFLETGFKIRVRIIYTGAHYTRINTVYSLYFKESEGLIAEFVKF